MNPIKLSNAEKEHLIFPVVADTFVQNGENGKPNNCIDKCFCQLDTLSVKGKNGDCLHRMALLKFDISSLQDSGFSAVQIELYGLDHYEAGGVPINLYDVSPDEWEENTITYRTFPEIGQFVCSFKASLGINRIFITDYVKEALKSGKSMLSFALANDQGTPTHMRFVSSRGEEDKAPTMRVNRNHYGYRTTLYNMSEAQTVWNRAAKMVEEWKADWKRISSKPCTQAELLQDDPDEYPLTVAAARVPKEPYFDRQTRTLDTIKNYTPIFEDNAKYDTFGGLICGIKFEKSQFFRIEKHNGRFWCITPEGNPFFRKGIVEVRAGVSQRQREAIEKRFDDLEKWAEYETTHLKELGFNSVGGWSDIENLSSASAPLALTRIVSFISPYIRWLRINKPETAKNASLSGTIPIFNPDFENFSHERAREVVSPFADNPHFFGWMSDNELEADFYMLDHYLTLDHQNPFHAHSYATAWSFLASCANKENVFLSDVTDEMRLKFRAMVYNRYFKLVSHAIKKHDPNHLFMGSRFLPGCYRDEYVNRVAGEYCDIITLNYYGAWTPESQLISDITRWSGRPFVVTEWYAKGMDVCTPETRLTNETGAGWTVKTQAERGYFYHNYALKLLQCKNCIGFDWFKMWDNDPDNEKADWTNRNANKGIYNSDYEEYSTLTSAMKRLNANTYKLIEHFDQTK